jgi:hypothetical protein
MQQRERNHYGRDTADETARPVDEQILHGPWPRDHEEGDTETYRVESNQYHECQY